MSISYYNMLSLLKDNLRLYNIKEQHLFRIEILVYQMKKNKI